MFLSSLRLTDFRNFEEQRLAIPREGVVLVGDNGNGKTNLLEAAYYLGVFRSFRGAPDENLVRFGATVFRVEGRIEDGTDSRLIAAAFDRRARRKKVTVDGVEPPRIGDALGRFGVVVFSPSDVTLVSGSPALRRRYLDILLSLTAPRYLDDLQRYRQVVLRRNALLRAASPAVEVAVWNEGLVRFGSRIVAARLAWLLTRSDPFAARVREISGGGDARLAYDGSVPLPAGVLDAASIEAAFRAELERIGAREQRRGVTLVGPHRDDVRISAAVGGEGWVDLRTYGSGGQQRTAAVALRMVEAETLRERLGSEPVLLLDDVFAELDVGRSRRILEWVDAGRDTQVILTAPKASDLVIRSRALQVWSVEPGRVVGL